MLTSLKLKMVMRDQLVFENKVMKLAGWMN